MGDEEVIKLGFGRYKLGNKWKGGFSAAYFVYVFAILENMAFIANMVSLVLYFYNLVHFDISGASNTLTNLMGSTFLLTLLGGFVSDTFLDRFTTCIVFGLLEVLSLVLMTIQANNPNLLPSPCGKSSCVKGGKAALFYISLALLAVGSGGVRGALPSLGADQFNPKVPTEAKALASYFNYLVLSTTFGALIGVTFIVWVSTKVAWWLGFLVCTVVTFSGFVVLILGKPFYRLQTPESIPILRIIQVIVASIKNRKLPLPENPEELYEINEKESVSQDEKISHTNQFRCLDKAAILREGSEPSPWTVCTVTQVEEVKLLTRMMPIIASTIIMNTCLAQLQTFSVEQGSAMDPNLGAFEFPAASIPVIPLFFMAILIPIYQFLFIPFARKHTGHPAGITQLQRVGVGLVLSIVSMAVAALVEVKRRNEANQHGKRISLFWLSFQFGIFGIADMFTLVGLLEFFYKEAPTCMKSLSTSFTFISLSLGYFLSTVFVNIINSVTKRIAPSKQGWLHGQVLDKNNLDLFYWFLAVSSFLNFLNYLYWASWYKYKKEEPKVAETDYVKEESARTDVVPSIKGEHTQHVQVEGKDESTTMTTVTTDVASNGGHSVGKTEQGEEEEEKEERKEQVGE